MSSRPPCPSCGKASFSISRQMTKGRKSIGFKTIKGARECRTCWFIFYTDNPGQRVPTEAPKP